MLKQNAKMEIARAEIRVNSISELQNGIVNHVVDCVKFTGPDIAYYDGERQQYRYAFIVRFSNGKIFEYVVADMLNDDNSWGSGKYYDDFEQAWAEYVRLSLEYDDYYTNKIVQA